MNCFSLSMQKDGILEYPPTMTSLARKYFTWFAHYRFFLGDQYTRRGRGRTIIIELVGEWQEMIPRVGFTRIEVWVDGWKMMGCVWRPIVTSMKMPARSRVDTALPFHSLGSFEVFPLINLQPNFRRHFVVLFYLLLHVKDNVAIYRTNFPIYPLVWWKYIIPASSTGGKPRQSAGAFEK